MTNFFGSSMFANARTVGRIESLEAKLYVTPGAPTKREQAKLESSLKFLNQRKDGQARRALDRMRSNRVAKSAAVVPAAPAPARARRGRGAAVRSSAASGDSPSSDDSDSSGEPPRRTPQLYSYQSAAVLLDCSVQTLYNQVNTGRIPAPLKTSIGPRFSQERLEQIIACVRPEPVVPVPVPTAKKKAGRPRIYVATTARSAGKVGAA